jgi:hypothetical protein
MQMAAHLRRSTNGCFVSKLIARILRYRKKKKIERGKVFEVAVRHLYQLYKGIEMSGKFCKPRQIAVISFLLLSVILSFYNITSTS